MQQNHFIDSPPEIQITEPTQKNKKSPGIHKCIIYDQYNKNVYTFQQKILIQQNHVTGGVNFSIKMSRKRIYNPKCPNLAGSLSHVNVMSVFILFFISYEITPKILQEFFNRHPVLAGAGDHHRRRQRQQHRAAAVRYAKFPCPYYRHNNNNNNKNNLFSQTRFFHEKISNR